jgi:two-component system chemotaxis response regulator CheB
MGQDGAAALLRMRQAGARTFAEHGSTAIVYGMPAEAVRLGAAEKVVPLDGIAMALLEAAK